MANTPILNLIYLDTHDSQTLAIGDASVYPAGFSILQSTLEVTPPSFPTISVPFPPKTIMIFNSDVLELTCTATGDCLADLPDGIYKVKYSVYPAFTYNIEKSFLRVEQLYARYDSAYLKLDIFQCDDAVKGQDIKTLDDIEDYIQGAIAAANKCSPKLALELYNKASKLLDAFVNHRCYLQ